ncbi:hypothetical protein VMCG_06796 [Cytospora schulzeri]|uniref:ABC transmembrane type-1 domain-containing protein n=1 Tax=Cytospora schulzeri TaxID=448051 RepID=A0A423W5W8_9PEZI|nr:hypothetical protein VMCG_06796 [Valsa malicola]
MENLYPLPPDMASALIQDKLRKTWARLSSKQPTDSADERGYALLRAAATALKWPLLAPVMGRLALIGFKYSQPFLLSTTVDYVQQDAARRPRDVGYGLIAATALVYLRIAVSTGFYNCHVFRATTLLRGALVSTIYHKTLSLNLADAKATAALTLSTTDVDRIGLTLKSTHEIWASTAEAVAPISRTPAHDEGVISILGATFPVGKDSQHVLRIMDLTCKAGSLTMVIGPVGSGKTTLMEAMLGEIQPSGGLMEKIVGPSGQRGFDEAWYRTVLWACALDKDVEQMPGGDHTSIGSRGPSIREGKLVALDDVLSALDARTEKLVFERLLSKDGLLRRLGATVVLITHAVHRLAFADQIVVLDQSGQVVQVGTFEELGSCNSYVREILADIPDHGENREQDGYEIEAPVEPVGAQPRTQPAARVESPSSSPAGKTTKQKQASESAVLVYYFQSIGWSRAILFLLLTLACVFCIKFPQAGTASPNNGSFLDVYFLLAVLAVATNAVAIWTMMIIIVPISAAKLHLHLLNAVMHAPMSFFTRTDSGSTLNRFSQDMSLVNSRLPVSVLQTTPAASLCLAQLALVATGSTYFAAFIPAALLRLLDLEQKSPLLAGISETLEGLSSVRAFGWGNKFERRYLRRRTLGVAMLNVLGFSQSVSQFVYNYTDMETSLQAVARVKDFVETVTPEDLPHETQQLPKDWPVRGAIEFQNVTASYDNNTTTTSTTITTTSSSGNDSSNNITTSTPPALDNISFTISPGQKVGICGRTGSGKWLSTLVGCDLVVVLDRGAVVAMGRPWGFVFAWREKFWELCRAQGVRPEGKEKKEEDK